MFDLLRKKISGFAEKVLGSARTTDEKETNETSSTIPQTEETTAKQTNPPSPAEKNTNTHTTNTHTHEKKAPIEKTKEEIESAEINNNESSKNEYETTEGEIPFLNKEKKDAQPLPEIKQHDEREIATKIGVFQKIGGLFTGTITLNEETVNQFLDEFEFSLLEADVELGTTQALITELRTRLTNKVISSRENPTQVILKEIKHAMREIIDVHPFDVEQAIRGKKPGIILILGPNGAGKTTTIAKLTHYFQQTGKKVILASADTFRAGSIEQLHVHANKLNARLVKHQYGADPAAVAYDAVKAAKAENADVVLIDTAGRQDTNKNLLEELKKIQRVIQPDAKIYVGESYTGQAILTQARTFDEAIGINGFILTKLDTDTKGGGVISILHNLKKPVLFFGTGQAYEDLTPFSMDEFLERLIPEKE
ncbi:MAG: signal recognition particle-docking protein FtsY [Candidatus Diapherotrites archaeon]|uniref:Signal recognition particle receptor FtsY n=1 Tax=Candidatus Iainarchaeum sp. TaxID=3101447 RepID=A0A8T4CC47_9ARCH|nr:signal recognition particle-docking protein FtsY [Candidatus Diapherotrites archaeon]